jgi:Ni,Fe-hydrogenase III large subunit
MGGTDDPSNLIELTVEEHAEAHRVLYEQYGREEDRMAWLALSGQATKKEICVLGYKLGRKKTDIILEQKYGDNWRSVIGKLASDRAAAVHKEKMKNDKEFAKKVRERMKELCDMALSDNVKEKRKKTLAAIGHQQGSKNSNYGNMWIHSLELKQNKTIKKTDPIPDGWIKGRKMKFQ